MKDEMTNVKVQMTNDKDNGKAQMRKMQDAGCRSLSCIAHLASCIRSHHALRNQRGIALVMVLILSAIILAIIAALVYMLTSGTQVSGIQKRYRTALEAGTGGKDAMAQLIAARGDPGISLCTYVMPNPCLTDKLTKTTSSWNAACDSSLPITPGTTSTYDMACTLGAYTAYEKIVDTVPGNSSGSTGLQKGGVVSSNSGEITVQSIPYLYTIEVDAENPNNSAERGKLSVLYQY